MTSVSISALERPTTPRDCSLLIAIPLHKQDFLADLESVGDKDFARSFSEGRRQSPDGLWSAYEPYARLAIDVAEFAERLGVTVIRAATLSDFAAHIINERVITLVAHWRSGLFTMTDLGLVQEMTETQKALLKQCTGIDAHGLAKEDLLANLNVFLTDGFQGVDFDSAPMGTLTRFFYAVHNRRMDLERSLSGILAGGSAVEFYDGFKPLAEVVARVPTDFDGIFDLTVCNSVLLGEEIRKRCDHCMVIMNEDKAALDFRFALYRQTIRCLAEHPGSFERVAVQLRKAIGERCG